MSSISTRPMADVPLPPDSKARVKETCRRIRLARSHWDAHRNGACRGERERALTLYNQLSPEEKRQIPQTLRVWLRYRSEKYFGAQQTPPRSPHRSAKGRRAKGKRR